MADGKVLTISLTCQHDEDEHLTKSIEHIQTEKWDRVDVDCYPEFFSESDLVKIFEAIEANKPRRGVYLTLLIDLERWIYIQEVMFENPIIIRFVTKLSISFRPLEKRNRSIALDWPGDHPCMTPDQYDIIYEDQPFLFARILSSLLDKYKRVIISAWIEDRKIAWMTELLEQITSTNKIEKFGMHRAFGDSPEEYAPLIEQMGRLGISYGVISNINHPKVFEDCIQRSVVLGSAYYRGENVGGKLVVNKNLGPKKKLLALVAGKELPRLSQRSCYTMLPMELIRLVQPYLFEKW